MRFGLRWFSSRVGFDTNTRTTACVSSQVGCSLVVTLRHSTIKRMRNLEPAEIYDQVIAIDKESRLYYNHPLSILFSWEWANH
jgi:adenine C2-methylase RlmN of 23S rRNA A2503 and tRNA A37